MFIQFTQSCVVGGTRGRQKIHRNDIIIPKTIHLHYLYHYISLYHYILHVS